MVQSITRCTKAFKSTRQIQRIGSDRHYSERYFSEMEGIVVIAMLSSAVLDALIWAGQ